jgi:Ran GTPase-activating protein (RanGAP) involved in mRNA processing and transport
LLVGENDIKAGEMNFFLEKFRVVGLVVMDLRSNLIGDEGCRMLVDVLGSSSSSNTLSRNLKHLNLSHNNLTSLSIEHYCKHMSTNQTLTSL